MRPALVATLVATLAVPLAVLAQTPAAPPAAAADAPKPSCTKPDEYPGKLAHDSRKKSWAKDVNAYIECMKKFIGEQKAQGDLHYAAGNAAIERLNKEIPEFNAATQRE